MKALVLTDRNQFSYTDFPMPECGDQEVLIQVKACGICGSDVHGMDGSTGRRRPPIIMGHEASGLSRHCREKCPPPSRQPTRCGLRRCFQVQSVHRTWRLMLEQTDEVKV